jgi:hypothetical protein
MAILCCVAKKTASAAQIQNELLLASMKSLANCEIPSNIPFQKACSGFLIAACAFKSHCESRL